MMDYLPTFYGKEIFCDWLIQYNVRSRLRWKKYLFDMTYPRIGILYDTYGCTYIYQRIIIVNNIY